MVKIEKPGRSDGANGAPFDVTFVTRHKSTRGVIHMVLLSLQAPGPGIVRHITLLIVYVVMNSKKTIKQGQKHSLHSPAKLGEFEEIMQKAEKRQKEMAKIADDEKSTALESTPGEVRNATATATRYGDGKTAPLETKETIPATSDEKAKKPVLLGKCDDEIVGVLHKASHPGAHKLEVNQKLTVVADWNNDTDHLAVRFFDSNGRSCGHLPHASELKPYLAGILLQQEFGKLSWLDRIEATYVGPHNKYGGWVTLEFYGEKSKFNHLHNTMKAVYEFTPTV